jgi:hypothetical protein
MDKDAALDLAGFWASRGFAIAWTQSKDGDGAKRVVTKGWPDKAELYDGSEQSAGLIAGRIERKNPCVVARKSNLILIDCDSVADVDAFKAFKPPKTLAATTGKGRHFYYRPDEGCGEYRGIYFEAGAITPKGDCYLVTPPAVHPSGRQYAWDNDEEIAVLPRATYRAMLAAAGVNDDGHKVREALPDDAKIPEGQRHDALISLAGRLRRDGVPFEEAFVACMGLNSRFEKPKSGKEVRGVLERAYDKYEEVLPQGGGGGDRDRPAEGRPKPKLDLLDDGLATMTRWFNGYEKIMPVGYHVGVVAPGGTGKGLFLVLLARAMSANAPLLYSGSEDNRDTLKRRIAASQVPAGCFVRFRVPEEDGEHDRQLRFPSDVDLLERTIVETGAAVFAYDAGPAHMDEGLDPNLTTDVRSVVDRLSEVAERTGCTIICILHPNKSSEMVARDKASGSKAWVDAMRHVLFMVIDDEEEHVRHLEVVKTNLGDTGYGWEMVVNERLVAQLDADGKQIEVAEPHIEHVGRSKKSVDIILSRDSKQKSVMKYALAWLQENGECESDAFEAMLLEEIDCKARTVRRGLDSLKKRKKIKSVRVGGLADDGKWFVRLVLPGEEELDVLPPPDDLPPIEGLDGL